MHVRKQVSTKAAHRSPVRAGTIILKSGTIILLMQKQAPNTATSTCTLCVIKQSLVIKGWKGAMLSTHSHVLI
jgi:hypothetical protein